MLQTNIMLFQTPGESVRRLHGMAVTKSRPGYNDGVYTDDRGGVQNDGFAQKPPMHASIHTT